MSYRPLPIQFRVHSDKQIEHNYRERLPVNQVLVFDTETTTTNQRLLFGSAVLATVWQDGHQLSAQMVRKIIFYADDLETFRPQTFKALKTYSEDHLSGTSPNFPHPTYKDVEQHGQLDIQKHDQIRFMSVSDFVRIYILGSGYAKDVKYQEYQPATIVGFNLSFDMWRLTTRVMEARTWFYGGLAGEFLNGEAWAPNYREMKAGIGMRRELTKTAHMEHDPAYLVDLSELIRAITMVPHSLLSAGKAFGCRKLKYDGDEIHDPEVNYTSDDLESYLAHYIAYNINDTEATLELWQKAMSQFLRHPIDLRPNLTFSAASISKQYVRDMMVHAPLCACKQCKKSKRGGYQIPKDVLGRCMSAFYGGRAECRIRLEMTPAVLCDFTSMYPTIMILYGIWELLVADRIVCRDETADIQELLDNLTENDLYRPETHRLLCGVAEFVPDSDLGPIRSPYNDHSPNDAAGIGINYLTADKPVTWTLADLAANKIQNNGKVPRLIQAWRFYPSTDKQHGTRGIKIYGRDDLQFYPVKDNFPKFLVEERQKAKTRHKERGSNRELANAKPARVIPHRGFMFKPYEGPCEYCYGQECDECGYCERAHYWETAEFDPFMGAMAKGQEIEKPKLGLEGDIARSRREALEAHRYDQVERTIWNKDRSKCLCPDCETERPLKGNGNSLYGVFAETNKPHNATPQTGMVYGQAGESWDAIDPEMPGEFYMPPFAAIICGGARLLLSMLERAVNDAGTSFIFCDTDSGCIPASPDGKDGGPIPVLSYERVEAIRKRFNSLNPYDPAVVKDLLNWEWPERNGESFPAKPIYATAISAKRYVLYYMSNGKPIIKKRSMHGLGLYVNPQTKDALNESDRESADWFTETWVWIIRRYILNQDIADPSWFSLPAVSVFPIRSKHVWEALGGFDKTRPASEQLSTPYNFYLAVHSSKLNAMWDVNERLIAPFTRDSAKWSDMTTIRVSDRKQYRITTDWRDGNIAVDMTGKVTVKSYKDVIWDYVRHPEIKYDDADGNPCTKDTRGILRSCHVEAISYQYITKDSSSITVAGDSYHHKGPGIYKDDSDVRSFMLAMEVIKMHNYTYHDLMRELNISEAPARRYLRGASVFPKQRTLVRLVNLAARLARQELKELDGWIPPQIQSDHQILAWWHHRIASQKPEADNEK